MSGPGSFGSGEHSPATSSTGDTFGIGLIAMGTTLRMVLVVPSGYSSGSHLEGTSTFDNQTFASLGVTPGTYVWSWGSGANADMFTLQIVPEPSSLVLLGTGVLGLLGYGAWRRPWPRA